MPESVLSRLARSTCCQRPNRDPPERREFSPGESSYGQAHSANPTVLETLQTYCAAQNPVNACIPQNFHAFSTSGKAAEEQRSGSLSSKTARNGMAFRLEVQTRLFFGARQSGRQKIEKRSYVWRFLALKVPFRNSLMFPNQVPWPGRLESLTPSDSLDAGRATRVADNTPG